MSQVEWGLYLYSNSISTFIINIKSCVYIELNYLDVMIITYTYAQQPPTTTNITNNSEGKFSAERYNQNREFQLQSTLI